jgi:hypothetical protein
VVGLPDAVGHGATLGVGSLPGESLIRCGRGVDRDAEEAQPVCRRADSRLVLGMPSCEDRET